jgi:PilZ domain
MIRVPKGRKHNRRQVRFYYSGPVRLFWDDAEGRTKYLEALCVDISENGLRVDSNESLPMNTRVSLRADLIELAGTAIVRHIHGQDSHFILGLEFSPALVEQALKLTRNPALLRTPTQIS